MRSTRAPPTRSCAIACPLGIDTGALVKGLRRERHGAIGARAARVAGANWEVVEWAARGALRAGHLLGDRATARISGAAAARRRGRAGPRVDGADAQARHAADAAHRP